MLIIIGLANNSPCVFSLCRAASSLSWVSHYPLCCVIEVSSLHSELAHHIILISRVVSCRIEHNRPSSMSATFSRFTRVNLIKVIKALSTLQSTMFTCTLRFSFRRLWHFHCSLSEGKLPRSDWCGTSTLCYKKNPPHAASAIRLSDRLIANPMR